MARLLVTGGAGYIGSHFVRWALEQGHSVSVLDNLVFGHREAVASGARLIVGDIDSQEALTAAFEASDPEAVVHFAAFAYVGESVADPARYYRNNTAAVLPLLDAVRTRGSCCFVFSSTCATYGLPVRLPLDESHPQAPISPYGESKLFVERILRAYGEAYGLRSASLRYFNAAGAAADGAIGESHDPETHLIPLVLRAAAGTGSPVRLLGTDYETPDGTCIRDYVHVDDLASAHGAAVDLLMSAGGTRAYNLGTGTGTSVRQVIEACGHAVGRPVPVEEAPRRTGDPPELVASAERAAADLGWQPAYTTIEPIVETAWRWERSRRY